LISKQLIITGTPNAASWTIEMDFFFNRKF